jgi:hypothetical protein
MQAAVGSMPLMTQNEARDAYLGLGPVTGGEQLMRPTAMQPAGETAEPGGDEISPEAAPAGKPEKFFKRQAKTLQGWNTNPIRVRTGGKTANSGAAQMRRALTDAFKNALNNELPSYKVKKVTELSHAEYMEHWKRFADRSEQAEAKLKEVFLGINKKQREDVIANLSEATGVKKGLGELFDPKEWMGITIDLTTPILTSLATDEAAAALAMIGATNQDILANASTQAALDRGISKMARSYTETTLQQLKDVLSEKLTQPGGTELDAGGSVINGPWPSAPALNLAADASSLVDARCSGIGPGGFSDPSAG